MISPARRVHSSRLVQSRWFVAVATLVACGPVDAPWPGAGGDGSVDLGDGRDRPSPDTEDASAGGDGGNGDERGPDPADDDALVQLLDERRQAAGFAGVSAAIVKDGELAWAGACGWADVERGVPVTVDTVFMLASISKTVVATAVMQLVERGELDLDDDVSAALPFDAHHPDFPAEPLTLRMLLTHTSSLRDDWDVLYAGVVDGDSPIALGDFLAEYVAEPSHYDPQGPGATYEYANVGVDLAAYVVEAVTGVPFDTVCEDEVFGPLGMDDTSWHLAGLDTSTIAVPYDADGNALAHYGYPSYPEGALRTSAPQLARFLAAFARGGELDGVRILEEATVAEMQREQDPELAPGQGLVWYWEELDDGWVIGHSGGDAGVATLMALRPDDGVGTIVLTNGNWDSDPEALYDMQARLFEEAASF